MPSRTIALLLAALALFIAGAAFVQFDVLSRIVPFLQDENRLPIIVDEGTLNFYTDDHDWQAQGSNRKWKLDHGKGKNISGFTISVVDVNDGDKALCEPRTGTHVTIDYAVGTTTRSFNVYLELNQGGDKLEPAIWSPVDLAVDNSQKRKFLRHAPSGEISSINVPGYDPCPIAPGPKVRVELKMK